MDEYSGKIKVTVRDDKVGKIKPFHQKLIDEIDSKNIDVILREHTDWNTLCNLSNARTNILQCLEIKKGASILEVNAGCGALTGFLCKKAERVLSITEDYSEAMVSVARNKEYSNFEIIVSEYDSLVLQDEFDYIVIDGDFRSKRNGKGIPELLEDFKKYLKTDGVMYIIAPNKYAINNFSGINIGVKNESVMALQGQRNGRNKYLSNKEFTEAIERLGFKRIDYYYPLPDRFFASCLVKDDYFESSKESFPRTNPKEYERYQLFDEDKVIRQMLSDGVLKTFSDAFIAVCTNDENSVTPNFVKMNSFRNPAIQTGTKVYKSKDKNFIRKFPVQKSSKAYIDAYKKKYELNCGLYNNVIPVKGNFDDGAVVFPYIEGKTLKDLILENSYDLESRLLKIKEYLNEVLDYKDDVKCLFRNSSESEAIFKIRFKEGVNAVRFADIDIIFDNIIRTNEAYIAIDYEWTFGFPVPVDFIKYRILNRFYLDKTTNMYKWIGENDFYTYFGLDSSDIDIFRKAELGFQYYVFGDKLKDVYIERYRHKDKDLSKLVEKYKDIDVEFNRVNSELNEVRREAYLYKSEYERLLNSKSYRYTKGFRAVFLRLNRVRNFASKVKKSVKYRGVWGATKHFVLGKREENRDLFINKYSNLESSGVQNQDIKFSIVVPLYNTPKKFLKEMIGSVRKQKYQNWELCLADGSDNEHSYVGRYCKELARNDSRILYKKLSENRGISDNTNECIKMASGDFIVLFDHDDVLHKEALLEVVKVLNNNLDVDFVYTDEATFEKRLSNVVNIHYKPDFSPDTLRSYNYICHLSVIKKSLLDEVGYFRDEYDGSQDYDLILRVTERAKHIYHIRRVLYFWRSHSKSVASDISAKPYTVDAAKKALSSHLERMGLKGAVSDSKVLSTYKIDYEIKNNPLVSILIPNKDHIEELETCIGSIYEKSTYRNFEIIVIENNSENKETFDYYNYIESKYDGLKVVIWNDEFNYSAINNYGAKYATGEYILLLNNDVEIISPKWIEEMLMFCQRSEVGAVGAMLYYPDDTVQHAGVILGIGGVAGHSHKYYPRADYGYSSRMTIAQNMSAVTAACMMVKKSVFDEVNGLDVDFKVAFNDIDLCMRIREKGYLIVFTPYAELYHYESKSRGAEDSPEKVKRFNGEIERFLKLWGNKLQKGDPYYNPGLSLIREDFSKRVKGEENPVDKLIEHFGI